MSHLEGDKLEEPEFKWLKERAGGKRYRDTHFYESFSYDGVEYSLYDSVYLHVESEQAPYIGMLVKIWEEANKSKKIKVQWFFRPSEIFYHLRDTEVLENELFFASGRGTGLANINSLESIVGKCNVVCTSIDGRNPQPSDNDRKMADYVFYRIFDVQSCMISDQLNGNIGELKVEFVFNREGSIRTLDSPKFESNNHDARNAIACKDTRKLVTESSPNISQQPNGDRNHMARNDDTNAKQVYMAKEHLANDVENGSFSRESTSGRKCSNFDANFSIDKAATGTIDDTSASGDTIIGCKINAERVKVKQRKSPLKRAQFEEKVKSNMKSHGLNDTSPKRGKHYDSSLKDNGKDVGSSKDRQAISTMKNGSVSCDRNDGCQVNFVKDKVKDKKSPLKIDHFGESVQPGMKSHCLNDTSLKRGKLDVNYIQDNEAIDTIDNKNVSSVKKAGFKVNVEKDMVKDKKIPLKQAHCGERIKCDINPVCSNDTSLKIGELIDKSSKTNCKTCVPRSIISGNGAMSLVKVATSCDAKLEFEINEDYGGLRKDATVMTSSTILNERISNVGTTSCPEILESENVANFGAPRTDLDLAKCWDASRGNSSRSNDVIGDELSKTRSNDDFGGCGQVDSHAKLSSNVSQLSKACVYPSDEEIDHGHDSFRRKKLSIAKDSCLGDILSKKAKLDDHNKPSVEINMEVIPKLKEKSCGIGRDAKHASTLLEAPNGSAYQSKRVTNHGHGACKGNDLQFAKDSRSIEGPSKKAKLDGSSKTRKLSISEVSQNSKEKSRANEDRKVHGHGACKGNDLQFAKDSCAIECPSKKAKLDGSSKTCKFIKNEVSQNSKEKSRANEDKKVEGEFEVSPRPMLEKCTWLKLGKLSWESMKTDHNEGKLVLLQNLDPTLTSAEVEDIIWHAFEEDCVAKMVQHTALSIPHNGQALLRFNSREVSERVVKKLDGKCLMLLKQRPLVGCIVLLPELPSRQTSLVGHLSSGKVRRLTQREMKEAVSTSHFSQSNTIEYEMAMGWCFLQSKYNAWWQKLFELQKMDLKKLTAILRLKMTSNVSKTNAEVGGEQLDDQPFQT